MEREGAIRAVLLLPAFYTQNVGPLVGEVVGVFRRVEQLINELVALRRVLVFRERDDVFGVRQGADQVEVQRRMKTSSGHNSEGVMFNSFHFFAVNLSTTVCSLKSNFACSPARGTVAEYRRRTR